MILLLSLLACPASDGKTDDSTPSEETADTSETGDSGLDPEAVELSGTCEDDVHYGNFTIDANEDYAYVTGEVDDGVVPATILTELSSAGGCTLWRKENPYCDPTCEPGYTCDFSGECVPYPEGQDLGTVSVDGLLEAVSMTPVVPGNSYFDTSVPNPPWTPGAVITLNSEGGAYDPFTLHGVAPDDLELSSLDWTLTRDQAFALSWTPPSTSTRTTLRLAIQIDQHGASPATVVCWLDDDGDGEIPAEVVNSLMDLGISGFPNGSAARMTADRADVGDGCVDLWLTSSRLPTVAVAGYTPCTRDEDCPDGQTCDEENERCE